MNYLSNGGNLYFESVNVGYDYSTTEFFDLFGINYLDDGGEDEVANLKGGCYNCNENLKYDYAGGVDAHLSVDHLEADSGEMLFSSNEGIGRVFVNEGDNYKVISSSIIAAAMVNGDSLNLKPYLFSEFINYFMGYNPVTVLRENLQQSLSADNYPNPFSEQTTISFNIENPGNVSVDIYNINGQLIKNLVSGKLQPGNHKVMWNTNESRNSGFEHGYYFYKITQSGNTMTGKMVLLP